MNNTKSFAHKDEAGATEGAAAANSFGMVEISRVTMRSVKDMTAASVNLREYNWMLLVSWWPRSR